MDVVMFGFNDWPQWEAGGFRTRCGAIARALSQDPSVERLLVVSTAHSIGINLVRVGRGRLQGSDRPTPPLRPFETRQVAEGVFTLEQTRLLPRDGSVGAAHRANAALHDGALRRAVVDACNTLQMRDWVLWVADPLMAKHIGRLGESVSVFDAIDDWSAHPEKRAMRAWVERGYRQVEERADVVFTVSRTLRDRLSTPGAAVHWQPNGVDATRFDGALAVPADLAALSRPLLGYVGVIQERLDVRVIDSLARALPSGSIALVGPVRSPRHVAPLRTLPNVHLLGERRADLVPSYIGAFDVCLVPHVDDELTRSMDPLKVYEYLAAGKPVVASGLPDMELPSGMVIRCGDVDAFIKGVRDSLDEATDGAVRASDRRAFARSRSWEARLAEMLAIIREVAADRGVVLV